MTHSSEGQVLRMGCGDALALLSRTAEKSLKVRAIL